MTDHKVYLKFEKIKEPLKALIICTSKKNQIYLSADYLEEKWNADYNVLDIENSQRYKAILEILGIAEFQEEQ